MTDPGVSRLEELARTDPTVAPMARLLALCFRDAAEPAWSESVPELDASRLADGLPLLHGAELAVDGRRLARHLAAIHAIVPTPAAAAGRRQDRARGLGEPLALTAASIRQDAAALDGMAAEAGIAPDLVATLAHAAALPLLLAAGRRAAPLLDAGAAVAGATAPHARAWDAGYCPVCAAWPTMAELRGLSRERWLRCGRCGAGWRFPQQRCAFCATRDHRQIGYLAPEANRESRRAATCDACRGYLKTISTLDAAPPAELAYQDLTTLELDVAAIERDYTRPETPAFPLAVTLVPAQRRLSIFR